LQTWGVPIFILLFGFCLYQLTHHYDAVGPSGWHASGEVNSTSLWLVMNMANGQIVFQGLMATDYGRFAKPGVTHLGCRRAGGGLQCAADFWQCATLAG
jgi:hypothetical protein